MPVMPVGTIGFRGGDAMIPDSVGFGFRVGDIIAPTLGFDSGKDLLRVAASGNTDISSAILAEISLLATVDGKPDVTASQRLIAEFLLEAGVEAPEISVETATGASVTIKGLIEAILKVR